METGEQIQGGAGIKKKVPASDDGGQTRSVVGDFKKAWHLFDGAGSQLLYMMCSTFAGTHLSNVTRDLLALQGPVFGCSKSELVLGRLKEMDNLLTGLQMQKNDSEEVSPSQVQMLCRCLLLFIKLQAEYHQMCSNSVSMVINHLAASGECPENRDLLHQLKALELNKYATSRQSPSRNIGHKKSSSANAAVGSPKSQKHGSFKASLFSLFERKNSPDEGNSSFYVDINQQQEESTPEESKVPKEMKGRSQITENNQSELLIQLGLDPDQSETSACEKSSAQDIEISTKSAFDAELIDDNGQVASQEELDSVINLLSGAGLNGSGMETIPEFSNPKHALKVGANERHASALSPAASDSCVNDGAELRKKSQRRSEGSIDVSGFMQQGHNTWPYQHRSSLPGGQLGPQICYDFSGPPPQQPYPNGMRPAMTLPPGGAAHFQAYNLGFPDPNLNRAWPVNNLAGPGTEGTSCTWSGALDSDDMSDDSSVGDQFHMLSQYPHLENSFFNQEGRLAAFRRDDKPVDVKHHSLEDLLDGRSNTWPQQLQPWSHSSQGLNLGDPNDQSHRPVTMQFSDPLTQRNVWTNPADGPLRTAQLHNVHGTGHM